MSVMKLRLLAAYKTMELVEIGGAAPGFDFTGLPFSFIYLRIPSLDFVDVPDS